MSFQSKREGSLHLIDGESSADLEGLLLAHLPAIERLIAYVCRRRCLRQEADDFAAWVKLRLIEDDYRILRSFSGMSSLESYLMTVLLNLARDYWVQLHGRWRPSAAAARLGERAVQLETLLYRDRRSLDEAARVLRAHYQAEETTQELGALAARLPVRHERRFEGEEALRSLAAGDNSEARLLEQERHGALASAEMALARAMKGLPAEDRLVLKLHFQDGLTITAIAHGLGLERRPLYHRVGKALAFLRRQLHAAGVEPGAVLDALGWEGGELRVEFSLLADAGERSGPFPPDPAGAGGARE